MIRIGDTATRVHILVLGDASGPLARVIRWLQLRPYRLTVLPANPVGLKVLGDLNGELYPDVVVAEVLEDAAVDSQTIVHAITGRRSHKRVQVLLLTREVLDLGVLGGSAPAGTAMRHVASVQRQDLRQAIEIVIEEKPYLAGEEDEGPVWIH